MGASVHVEGRQVSRDMLLEVWMGTGSRTVALRTAPALVPLGPQGAGFPADSAQVWPGTGGCPHGLQGESPVQTTH